MSNDNNSVYPSIDRALLIGTPQTSVEVKPGSLIVSGQTTLNDALTVANGKDTTLGGALNVTGQSSFSDKVSIGANDLPANLKVIGDLTVSGTVSGNVDIGANDSPPNLKVIGDLTVSSTEVSGKDKGGKLTVKELTVSDTVKTKDLTVTRNVSIGAEGSQADLKVIGDLTVSGTVSGNVDIGTNDSPPNLKVIGDLTVSSTQVEGEDKGGKLTVKDLTVSDTVKTKNLSLDDSFSKILFGTSEIGEHYNNSVLEKTIDFEDNFFNKPPKVTVTPVNNGNNTFIFTVKDVTKSGFNIIIGNITLDRGTAAWFAWTTKLHLNWIAWQEPAPPPSS